LKVKYRISLACDGMLRPANNLLTDAINHMVYEDSTGKEGK